MLVLNPMNKSKIESIHFNRKVFTRSLTCVFACVVGCSNIDFRFDRVSTEGVCFRIVTGGSTGGGEGSGSDSS
jgi:hypothetical protein